MAIAELPTARAQAKLTHSPLPAVAATASGHVTKLWISLGSLNPVAEALYNHLPTRDAHPGVSPSRRHPIGSQIMFSGFVFPVVVVSVLWGWGWWWWVL